MYTSILSGAARALRLHCVPLRVRASGVYTHSETAIGVTSILDTACGTGRGWLYLKGKHPDLKVRGNDISMALIRKAVLNGVPANCLEISSSFSLPYKDNAFDFAIETGSLHHVAEPRIFVAEMLRVARMGIAISDSNMYVSGVGASGLFGNSIIGSLIKLLLCRSGLWDFLKRLFRGRRYSISTGDGVSTPIACFKRLKICKRYVSKSL